MLKCTYLVNVNDSEKKYVELGIIVDLLDID